MADYWDGFGERNPGDCLPGWLLDYFEWKWEHGADSRRTPVHPFEESLYSEEDWDAFGSEDWD